MKAGSQGFHEKGGSQGVYEKVGFTGGSRKGGFTGGFTKRGVHVNPVNPPWLRAWKSCRAGFSLCTCVDLVHTGQAYSAAE